MQRLIILLLASLLSISFAYSVSVTGGSNYPAFCQSAAENDTIFFQFKRHPACIDAYEHVTYQQGLECMKIINNQYPELLKYADAFAENDAVGDPWMHYYEEVGWISPTTVRFVKVIGDLIQEFGDLRDKHIVEIGGGYGGLCKILHDVIGFASYTLIDLPECNALSKKYINFMGIKNVKWVDSTQTDKVEKYDLIISNYAFSEIDRTEQKGYLEKVLLPTPNGYMIYNFVSSVYGLSSYSSQEVVDQLSKKGWKTWVEEERPATGNSVNPNVIIKWNGAAK